MSPFAEGLFRLVEKQREVFRQIVGLKSPTDEELKKVQQLARSALDRDLGMLVSPMVSQPLSDEVAYAGWDALAHKPEVKYNETEAFVAGVRFAESRHRIGEASEVVHMLPPAVLNPIRPLLKTPSGSIDPSLVVSTYVYKTSSPEGHWYCVVTMQAREGRDITSTNKFDTEDEARGLDDAIQEARNALGNTHTWLPFLTKKAPEVGG